MTSAHGGRLSPPSGAAPPTIGTTTAGESVDVLALAEEVCRRYRTEFPDEQERYGDAGHAWCVHDNQYILFWALLDARRMTNLAEQVSWLARVLHARHFPLDRLVRDLEICAEVVEQTGEAWAPDIAQRLRGCRDACRPTRGRP